MNEVKLPPGRPGTKRRSLRILCDGVILKSIPMNPMTTNITLAVKPGWMLEVADDDVITKVTGECPAPVETTVAPPVEPTGTPPEAPGVEVASMTPQERLAAGYRPTPVNGKIEWVKA